MNLFDYLEYRDSLRSVHHASERAGASLAALHRSGAALPTAECGVVGEPLHTRIARAETRLRSLSGLDFVALFRDSVRQLAQRSDARLEQVMDPIHGSFGWDSVYYGADGCFYLYRFENCRRSDPGLDLGGFAADLLCFTLAHYNAEAYRVCSDKLLKHYNAEAEHRMDEVDLRCYMVLALCDRIERPDRRTPFSEDDLVTALKVAFRGGPD
jgi:hypothetical protein